MIHFIADTHFGDKNVLKYENLPFINVEEMDDFIIQAWNKTVNKEDIVYVLGDVGVYTDDKMKNIIKQLNGAKILIMGNHDINRTPAYWREIGFSEAYDVQGLIIQDWIVLSHKPPEYQCKNTPWFHIYGHVHNSEMYQTVTSRTACVCLSRWNYAPVSLNKIIGIAKTIA